MKRTVSVLVSEEMYEFMMTRVRDRCLYTVSDYVRSLIRKDEASQVLPRKRSNDPGPRPLSELWNDEVEQ